MECYSLLINYQQMQWWKLKVIQHIILNHNKEIIRVSKPLNKFEQTGVLVWVNAVGNRSGLGNTSVATPWWLEDKYDKTFFIHSF